MSISIIRKIKRLENKANNLKALSESATNSYNMLKMEAEVHQLQIQIDELTKQLEESKLKELIDDN